MNIAQFSAFSGDGRTLYFAIGRDRKFCTQRASIPPPDADEYAWYSSHRVCIVSALEALKRVYLSEASNAVYDHWYVTSPKALVALTPGHQDAARRSAEETEASFAPALAFYARNFTPAEFAARRAAALYGHHVHFHSFLPTAVRQCNPLEDEAIAYVRDQYAEAEASGWKQRWRSIEDFSVTHEEDLDPGVYEPFLAILDSAARRYPKPRTHVWLFGGQPADGDPGEILKAFGEGLSECIDAITPIGPMRKPPSRWYAEAGLIPTDVGYEGQHYADLLAHDRHLLAELNACLRALDVGYELQLDRVGSTAPDLCRVQLLDQHRRTPVAVPIADAGYGFSQLVPILVQALAGRMKTVLIEQPELHVHPRLQAELGSVLATAVKEPYVNQFIIETHSEHLLLRMQRLVRKGQLTADDVAILYVARGQNGSLVQQIRLAEDGSFLDPWPGGFFPERMDEIFGD